MVTEVENAKENVELAVFSAIEHSRLKDVELAARIAYTALRASIDIDTLPSQLYFELVCVSLFQSAPEVLKAAMNLLGYEYQSEFARRYVAQGRAEGRAEGRADLILQLLQSRFGHLSDTDRTRVRSAQEAQLNIIIERMLTARTLEEALGPQP